MPYQLYINGQWRDGAAGKTVDVENPATRAVVATSAYGEVSDAIDAMDAAATAFASWKAQTAYVRGGHIDKAAALIPLHVCLPRPFLAPQAPDSTEISSHSRKCVLSSP